MVRRRALSIGLTILVAAGGLVSAASTDTHAAAAATGPRLVQVNGATERTSVRTLRATFPRPTHAGDLLVLSASVYAGPANRIVAVRDSAGRSWRRIGYFAVSRQYSDGELWYAPNAAPITRVAIRMRSRAVVAMTVQEFA